MPLFGKHKNTGHHDVKHDTRRDATYDTNPRDSGAGTGAASEPGMQTSQAGYAHTVRCKVGNPMGTDQYAHTGAVGMGGPAPGVGASMNPSVPPASHINTSSGHTSGGAGSRLAGKAERAAGAMVGSQALKEKGFQKEQEAGAFKMQSAEIAEAERLEKEALMRRERAVAHGAHPDNRHLGGMQNANTLSDVTGGQAGQPTMRPTGGASY
ncbi:hypothetical protein C8Q79DRAFT_916811 [Trametes meyenii]|nr:hypothetical protein C8Q79DRAFT_916811 [Trametes meyenii]